MLRVSKGLLTSLWPSPSLKLHFLHFALNTDSYREPGSALQGAAPPRRATISLLVNKSVSNNPSSPPLCLDRPAQPRRGCFVREGGEWQTTWAPLQSTEREREKREGCRTRLPELVRYQEYFRSHRMIEEILKRHILWWFTWKKKHLWQNVKWHSHIKESSSWLN